LDWIRRFLLLGLLQLRGPFRLLNRWRSDRHEHGPHPLLSSCCDGNFLFAVREGRLLGGFLVRRLFVVAEGSICHVHVFFLVFVIVVVARNCERALDELGLPGGARGPSRQEPPAR
jgi:hypothetical protein